MNKILFIGSESYDGPTITIIEGLHKLGYTIYVYKKDNINSWFCNTIINDLEYVKNKIDFIISNLHWGTRWDLYKHLNPEIPRILIDGDDHNNKNSWIDKYAAYCKSYGCTTGEHIENQKLSRQRFMINIEYYKPDIIFKTQKFVSEGIYLPFGINFSYLPFNKNIPILERNIDISHFQGPGIHRQHMATFINNKLKIYKVFNDTIYGDMVVDARIKYYCENDNNVHSWHRWKTCDKYFDILNNSKICIYVPAPGGWDSKRPWEILSQGTIMLYCKPRDFKDGEYPLNKISNYCEFKNNSELLIKVHELLNNPELLKQIQRECYTNAFKYFKPEAMASYFMTKVQSKMR